MNGVMIVLTIGALCLSCLPAEGDEVRFSAASVRTTENSASGLVPVEDVAAQAKVYLETPSRQPRSWEQVERMMLGTSVAEKRELGGLHRFSIFQALLLFSAGFGFLIATRQVGLRREPSRL